MGLFERTRHLADARLRALTEPGGGLSVEAVRRAVIELDGYRRELGQQLAKHRREEFRLFEQAAERSAGLALWQARRSLAHEHGRSDLVDAATRRAERERAERADLESRRTTIHGAVANLVVNLEKVERSLRLLRSRSRADADAGASAAGDRIGGPATSTKESRVASDAATLAPGPESSTAVPTALDDPVLAALGMGLETPPPEAPSDPIEAEFQRLEHEEVARHIDRRIGPG